MLNSCVNHSISDDDVKKHDGQKLQTSYYSCDLCKYMNKISIIKTKFTKLDMYRYINAMKSAQG